LAEEIGVEVDMVYRSGLPRCSHERGAGGNIWIIGTEFLGWARSLAAAKRAPEKMPEGYARCFRCNRVTPMVAETVRPTNRNVELEAGKCAECGAVVYRAKERG
jgi:uncharacterized protein with PIN domain